MDAIILAGGKGTRLQNTIGRDIPKPLALINDTPFLDILIEKLQSFKVIDKIILSVGYKKEKIIDRYKNKKNIILSEEDFPLGTGGAIKKAISLSSFDEVLVLNGDSFVTFNPNEMLNNHKLCKADITIGYKFEEDISRYGHITIDKKSQKILKFNEKQNPEDLTKKNGYINCGIYILNKNIFDNFEIIDDPKIKNETENTKNFSIETDFFPKIIFSKKIFGYEISAPFIDIGTASSYQKAQKMLKS